jgi:membrane protease subunit HflK
MNDDPFASIGQLFQLLNLRRISVAVVIVLVAVAGFTCFYAVEPDEEAVVLRLGKYHATTGPGLHFKFPLGIDNAIKLPTARILQEEFGFRSLETQSAATTYSQQKYDAESLMVTGDLNVADVEWITQYQISDPMKYLFHTGNPVQNVRDISQAVMRRVVGDRLVNDVLTVGRVEIAAEALRLTQDVLDRYDMGVRVVSIKLQDVNPPELVKPSFNDVNSAKQEQEQMINQAERGYNEQIPKSRGEAEEQISTAEGYATAVLNHARGDAEKFKMILTEYSKAPAITRRRIYLDTIEKLYSRFDRITIVDENVKGLLPIFEGAESKGKGKPFPGEGR